MEAIITPIPASSEPVILIPEDSNRLSAGIFNDADQILYLKYGMDPALDSFTLKIYPRQFFNVYDKYTGVITGFWSSGAVGSAMLTELYATAEQALDGEVQ